MTKAKTAPKDTKTDDNTLRVYAGEGESFGSGMARAALSPSVNAALSISNWHPCKGQTNVNDLRDKLILQAETIAKGDFSRPEAMLSAQAHTLDTLFNTLVLKAGKNSEAGYMQAAETYLRLAFKAQSQCRSTWESLAEIKYPKTTTFVKQANIAGQQQVNNGVSAGVSTQTPFSHEKTINPSNELLTGAGHAALDTGRTGATIGADSQLETVGAINRRKVSSRQSKVGG